MFPQVCQCLGTGQTSASWENYGKFKNIQMKDGSCKYCSSPSPSKVSSKVIFNPVPLLTALPRVQIQVVICKSVLFIHVGYSGQDKKGPETPLSAIDAF